MTKPVIEKVWCVYVVRCSDDSLYTGITTDVTRRVKEHNSGARGAKYTRSRRPVELETCWPAGTRSAALKAEYAFKKYSREQKLAFIRDYCVVCRAMGCECELKYGFTPAKK